ncbi:MAG: TetR/AcrR family transcriptional regulator [Bacillota bacterium]|nr:TetR/AcrR family transcriptional regulator [Bacillota bacterium]REJ37494.1 MAG: TetR/AcrR family transcriptional regulator [Bacillota bacterium]
MEKPRTGSSEWVDSAAESDTKRRILEAAAEVFAEKGYYATAVDDIVRASDTSKGSFYHFFPNKQGIFLSLVDHMYSMLLRRVESAIEQERGAIHKVDAALRTVLGEFARHRRLARILLIEAAGLGHAFNDKLFQLHAGFAGLIKRYLDRAVAEGSIPPLDTELAAYAWLGAINEVVTRWLYTGQPDPLDKALPELRAMLLRSIGAELEGGAGQ